MDVIRTITPGQKGSIRFLNKWGDKLVSVRYRRNAETNEVLTTIEIIVDRRPIAAPGTQIKSFLIQRDQQAVALRIGYQEEALRHQVKQAGAKWSRQLSLWVTKRKTAVQLGLVDRIVDGAIEKCLDIDTSLL